MVADVSSEAWAIIGAAVITGLCGFGVIAWQTRTGFKSLIEAQKHQAKHDKDARDDNARLLHNAELRSQNEQRRILASSLSAELSYLYASVHRNGIWRKILIAAVDKGLSEIPNMDLKNLLNFYNTRIYDESIKNLGVLGPSIAGDVITVYSFVQGDKNNAKAMEFSDPIQRLAIVKGIEEATRDWLLDVHHVHARLLYLQGVGDDPGPLFFERQKREKGATAEVPQILPSA